MSKNHHYLPIFSEIRVKYAHFNVILMQFCLVLPYGNHANSCKIIPNSGTQFQHSIKFIWPKGQSFIWFHGNYIKFTYFIENSFGICDLFHKSPCFSYFIEISFGNLTSNSLILRLFSSYGLWPNHHQPSADDLAKAS